MIVPPGICRATYVLSAHGRQESGTNGSFLDRWQRGPGSEARTRFRSHATTGRGERMAGEGMQRYKSAVMCLAIIIPYALAVHVDRPPLDDAIQHCLIVFGVLTS